MKVELIEVDTGQKLNGFIEKASWKDMPLKKNGWQFTWRTLFKTEGAELYKLVLESDETIQGMLMLSLMNDEMLYMNNIEVAPQNYGSDGKYENVAGCLIAFACMQSFELGQGHYQGFLTFQSKTALIPFYQKKYGASIIGGHRMFIAPNVGTQLIKKYLNKDI